MRFGCLARERNGVKQSEKSLFPEFTPGLLTPLVMHSAALGLVWAPRRVRGGTGAVAVQGLHRNKISPPLPAKQYHGARPLQHYNARFPCEISYPPPLSKQR